MFTAFRPFFLLIFLAGNLLQISFADEWDRVFLASFPRSGNHWIRYLVEEATHVATGSVYRDKDPMHLKKKFPWGGYTCKHGYMGNCRYPQPLETVLIKTHFPALNKTNFDSLPAVKTLRIVRHPIDSFFSFYKYAHHSATPDEILPEDVIARHLKKWIKFQEYWNNQENVVTVRYEDLLESPAQNLELILKNAGFKFTQADVERAVQRFPPQGHVLKHIKNFRREDLLHIKEELKGFLEQFNYTIPLEE